eukprot:CAMPEP_0198689410 /NCGR_PEP_ID=MMETSP1468-20131203/139630_1 /TAXON_ID=1461545 /ORGANISM="Mantoniella sp, Strain CCMP1436" /LENGTH=126 /DNA_ID=CAMNT_0044440387 /DNA_START=302 /DNA_END=680 /DNA_ORIENTATION=+
MPDPATACAAPGSPARTRVRAVRGGTRVGCQWMCAAPSTTPPTSGARGRHDYVGGTKRIILDVAAEYRAHAHKVQPGRNDSRAPQRTSATCINFRVRGIGCRIVIAASTNAFASAFDFASACVMID